MMIPIRHTLATTSGLQLNVTGATLTESLDVILRLDAESKAALSEACGFKVGRVMIVSSDGIDVSLYVECRAHDNIVHFNPLREYEAGFVFKNELEAFGLYKLVELATPRE